MTWKHMDIVNNVLPFSWFLSDIVQRQVLTLHRILNANLWSKRVLSLKVCLVALRVIRICQDP